MSYSLLFPRVYPTKIQAGGATVAARYGLPNCQPLRKNSLTYPEGPFLDGRTLSLMVEPFCTRSRVFRHMIGCRQHDLGLGPADNDVDASSLAVARERAAALRKQV